MLRFVPFSPHHLDIFEPDPAMLTAFDEILSSDLDYLGRSGGWSAIDGQVVVACGGLQPVWAGRAVAWGLLSPLIGPKNFLATDRQVRRVLAAARADGYRRIEAAVDPSYPRARTLRWVLSLGFRVEGIMKNWGRDGRDMWLVAITGETQ